MSQTLAVASRELAEKRFVLYAAVAFAVVAVLVPFVPGVHSSPRETIAVGSLILAIGFTAGLAAILGANVIGRDVSSGRMSFYFARPIAAPAIWFGKLGAALLLVLVSFGIIILPAVLAGTPAVRLGSNDFRQLLEITALAVATAFFLTHAVGTMVRSHSAVIAADFAAACVTAALIGLIARPVYEAHAVTAASALSGFLFTGAIVAVLIAGLWQVADGRSDRRRSHIAFSKAFWSGIAVVLLLAAVFVGWLTSAKVGDVDPSGRLQVEQAAHGEWALVMGDVPHRLDFRPAFLVSARTGASERLHSSYWYLQFSSDGRKLIALTTTGAPRGWGRLVVRDLATSAETDTHFVLPQSVVRVASNADASRLAIASGATLTVYDVAADRSLLSARMPVPASMFFAGPDLLRAYTVGSTQPRALTAYEIDVPHHAVRKTGEITRSVPWVFVGANADGSRVVVNGGHGVAPAVLDAGTLQTVSTLPPNGTLAFYLTDGRIVIRDSGPHAALTVIGTDGAAKTIDLGAGITAGVVRELAPGKVLTRVSEGFGSNKWAALVVDVDRGVVERRESGTTSTEFGLIDDPRPSLSGGDMLLVTKTSIVRWNALTGEKKPLG